MAVLVMLLMIFSVMYMTEEMHHDCTGEDCPICECIHMCEGILYETDGAGILIISTAAAVMISLFTGTESGYILRYDTPVSEKVRMDS